MNNHVKAIPSGSHSVDQETAKIEQLNATVADLLSKFSNLSAPERHHFFHKIECLSTDHLSDEALVEPGVASYELKVTPTTLSIWRCTGRYHLPYVKIGRLVRYRMGDLREFKHANRLDTRPAGPDVA